MNINIALSVYSFLSTTIILNTEPKNDPMAHTCPNPSCLVKTSLNSPYQNNASDFEQEICALGVLGVPSTQRTASRGNWNSEMFRYLTTIMPGPILDQIPEVPAILTATKHLAPEVFVVLPHHHKDQIKSHRKLLTNSLQF